MTKFLVYTLCLRKIDQIIHIYSFFPTVMTFIWARNIFHTGNLLGAIMMIKISVKEMTKWVSLGSQVSSSQLLIQ